MVRSALLLLALLTASAPRAADLRVELPGPAPHTAELGRAFTLELRYRGEADLERIPLTAWETDFDVDRGYVRREDKDQRLRLRLTPRRSGTLLLTPLQLGPADSAPASLQVEPAREDGELLTPRWQVSETYAWQGQEIVASFSLDSGNTELRLATAEPRWPGFAIRHLPPVREPLADGRTRYRFVWLLRALAGGEQPLAAPELRLLRNGVPVRRFHFPLAMLGVRTAPAYLPPTVPVGRLEGQTDAEGRHWLLGHGVPAGLLQATLERAGLAHRGIAEQLSPQGTLSRARIDWDTSNVDAARLLYFDPQAGRLQQLDIAAPPPPAALWLLLPAAVLITWLFWQRRRTGRWLRRAHARRRLLRRLGSANGLPALKAALLDRQRTLGAWLADWQADFQAPAELAETLHRLEAACYGDAEPSEGLGGTLRTAIRRSRPRW